MTALASSSAGSWSGFPDDFTEKYDGAYEIILKVFYSSE